MAAVGIVRDTPREGDLLEPQLRVARAKDPPAAPHHCYPPRNWLDSIKGEGVP